MAFIQSCFIRKNTPELRNKLQDMGYRQNIYDKNEYPWLAVNHNMFISVSEGFERLPEFNIDCGTNEELFLALAALRDDTPINSYYWFNDNLFKCEGLEIDRVLKNNTANYLLKCRHVDNSMIISCFKERNMIKATVEEIIEHFNKK